MTIRKLLQVITLASVVTIPAWGINNRVVRNVTNFLPTGQGGRFFTCPADLDDSVILKRSLWDSKQTGVWQSYMGFATISPVTGSVSISDATCVTCGNHGALFGTSPIDYGATLTDTGGIRTNHDCSIAVVQIALPGSTASDGAGTGIGFNGALLLTDWTPGALRLYPHPSVGTPGYRNRHMDYEYYRGDTRYSMVLVLPG